MDRYFAQVLPADKADYVAKLQREGRKVCSVGDGINDCAKLRAMGAVISALMLPAFALTSRCCSAILADGVFYR